MEQIHVGIVGAGLGGLAAAIEILRAGHRVTIFEQAAALGEIGAGIQIPPNSSRILRRWGLLARLKSFSVSPEAFIVRSYRDGKVLNRLAVTPDMEVRYGAPYLQIHRADFHAVLVEEAERLGAKFNLGSAVKSLNFDKPSVLIKDGSEFCVDIIVGADGLKSTCREAILGHPDPPYLTGNLAYRITVRAEDMMQHPELVELASSPAMTTWVGPNAHAVCYLLKGGGVYNIVLVCPDNLPQFVQTAKANREEMLDFFKLWDPRLRLLLTMVHETSKWRLQNSKELNAWSHPSGNCVLLGDACHATLPNLAQGAALAIEDGAVLGSLLAKVQTTDQLKDIVVIYEDIRKARTTKVVKESTKFRNIFHMRDGPEQLERDRQLLEEPPFEGYPHRWADPVLQQWLYGYDAHAEVQRAWGQYVLGRFPGTAGRFRAIQAPVVNQSRVATGA